MKHSLKNFLVFFWKSFINNNSGFKLYNYLQENKYLPYFLLDIFVRLNRHAVTEAKGKKNAYLNLVGNDKKLLLPDLLTESHWQFFQSYRWHDPFYAKLIRIFLQYETPGSFLDIGANQGLRSLDPLNYKWNVEAIEPNLNAINFLKKILIKNNFIDKKKIRIHLGCAGKESKKVKLYIDKSSYLSQVDEIFDKKRFSEYQIIDSEVFAINDIVEEFSIDISSCLCKIDTEGYELEVIKGLNKFFKNIRAYFIEVNPDNLNQFINYIPENSVCFWINNKKNSLVDIRDIKPTTQVDFILINKLSHSTFIALKKIIGNIKSKRLEHLITI